MPDDDITYEVNPSLSIDELNSLFSAAWPDGDKGDYLSVLARSLAYVCAFGGDRLIGFVNIAWDGGVHGFIVDTTVLPEYQHRGIGTRLVQTAADVARARGLGWLHVDYGPELEQFYRQCGFQPAHAAVMRL